jgi:hypothetical protein
LAGGARVSFPFAGGVSPASSLTRGRLRWRWRLEVPGGGYVQSSARAPVLHRSQGWPSWLLRHRCFADRHEMQAMGLRIVWIELHRMVWSRSLPFRDAVSASCLPHARACPDPLVSPPMSAEPRNLQKTPRPHLNHHRLPCPLHRIANSDASRLCAANKEGRDGCSLALVVPTSSSTTGSGRSSYRSTQGRLLDLPSIVANQPLAIAIMIGVIES